MLFQQDNPLFLSIPSVVCTVARWWLSIKPVCWWWDDNADLKMDRLTADATCLQLAATVHVGSQALGEVRHRLVDVFLWQLFPDGLQSDFQLISRLRLRLGFILLFQHGTSDVVVQRVQIWRVSMNTGEFPCSKFCTMLETLRNWGVVFFKRA